MNKEILEGIRRVERKMNSVSDWREFRVYELGEIVDDLLESVKLLAVENQELVYKNRTLESGYSKIIKMTNFNYSNLDGILIRRICEECLDTQST